MRYPAAGILSLMTPPDSLDRGFTENLTNMSATQPMWPPDFTMVGRVRQTFGKWLIRSSPFNVLPLALRKDLAEASHKYHVYTAQALLELSRDIRDPDKFAEKQVLHRISLHIASDISLCSPDLRHHLKGFIAVLKVVGGMQTALENNQVHKVRLWLIIIAIIMTNTTSPAYDQMAVESCFTSVDIYLLQAQSFMGDFPCPIQLLLCISGINDLRRRIASGACVGQKMQTATQAMLLNIDSFQPHAWQGLPGMPEPEIYLMLAAAFKRATGLYGMMTLASHAGISFDAPQRISDAYAIVETASLAVKMIGYHIALTWPVVVAGAAAGGAPVGLQADVEDLLCKISRSIAASDGILLTHQCLRRFWASGKTEWDECFTQWQAPIP
ncbi:hypothetical protein PWT90_09599 [Aphanocladium album]|nr:hypothetical protein PWT90_09599 [Aphanocladium album]